MTEGPLSKGERTHRAIVDAAYDLFNEKGYHATSMRQIAERSGLALGGIYNHFSSKEAVYTEILMERHPYHQILPALKDAKGETAEEFVRNAAQTLIKELESQPDFLRLMLIEIVEFEGSHIPKLFKTIFPNILPLAQKIAGMEKNLRSIPAPVLLRAFLGMFFSFYITEIMIGLSMPIMMQKNALNYFVDIYLHGILKPE